MTEASDERFGTEALRAIALAIRQLEERMDRVEERRTAAAAGAPPPQGSAGAEPSGAAVAPASTPDVSLDVVPAMRRELFELREVLSTVVARVELLARSVESLYWRFENEATQPPPDPAVTAEGGP